MKVRRSVLLSGSLVALGIVFTGCSSKDSTTGPGNNGSTSFNGALAATDGRTGSLTLTSPAASASVQRGPAFSVSAASDAAATATVINLTGTVSLSDGTTATLTGTWDTSTGALSVSGGGFTFSGTIVNGHLSGGSFTGPSVTGIFSLQASSASASVSTYCGTYTGRTPEDLPSGGTGGNGPDNGTWNLVASPTTVDVVVLSASGDPAALSGTRSGNAVTITIPGAGSASGTISGSASEFVKGTFTVTGGGQGTFQGSLAACTATAESAPIATIVINSPGIRVGGSPPNYRLQFDSTLVYATAFDAAGNFVAAPDLVWSYTGPVRSNAAVTPRGQKWFVPTAAGSSSVVVTSRNNGSVTSSSVVLIQ